MLVKTNKSGSKQRCKRILEIFIKPRTLVKKHILKILAPPPPQARMQ